MLTFLEYLVFTLSIESPLSRYNGKIIPFESLINILLFPVNTSIISFSVKFNNDWSFESSLSFKYIALAPVLIFNFSTV